MICSMENCDKPIDSHSLCGKHAQRLRRHGNPLTKIGAGYQPIEDRFFSRVDKKDCWVWTGRKDKKGYGRFRDEENKTVIVHRWAYKHFVGELVKGQTIDHKCHNTSCVNPKHLQQVSYRNNIIGNGKTNAAYINSIKTHCSRGHDLKDAKIRETPYGVKRDCKLCSRIRAAKQRQLND